MPAADTPVLHLVHLRKAYDALVAVADCSLDLRPGDILALVGPNGAGKTTTMKMVCGILTPDHGSVAIAGHDLRADPVAAKSALAYVPDDPKLFDAMTVWEHLRFTAAMYRVYDWQPRAEALLSAFELEPKRHTISMELSRGMRQKVAIACAYLHEPAVIMLDEPLTGLDPLGIRVTKESIRTRAAAGAGVILSSHLLSLVEDLCTRVLIMVKGEVRFDGTMNEARARFASAPDASLEDVFFSATSDTPTPAPAATGPAA